MSFLRESKWKYETAANGGVGVEFVMASGGAVWLLDPQKGEHRFVTLEGAFRGDVNKHAEAVERYRLEVIEGGIE